MAIMYFQWVINPLLITLFTYCQKETLQSYYYYNCFSITTVTPVHMMVAKSVFSLIKYDLSHS